MKSFAEFGHPRVRLGEADCLMSISLLGHLTMKSGGLRLCLFGFLWYILLHTFAKCYMHVSSKIAEKKRIWQGTFNIPRQSIQYVSPVGAVIGWPTTGAFCLGQAAISKGWSLLARFLPRGLLWFTALHCYCKHAESNITKR